MFLAYEHVLCESLASVRCKPMMTTVLLRYAGTLARTMLNAKQIRTVASDVKEIGKRFSVNEDYYVWVDLEMTGLDVKVDKILEIAVIITNKQLEKVHEGIDVVINQPKEVLNKCSEWVKECHTKNGLLGESSKSKISTREAEMLVLDYIKKHTSYEHNKGRLYIAGNSVYMDKMFLKEHMSDLHEIFHYRIIDVSSIKVLCSSWYPKIYESVKEKKFNHRSLTDIEESINELKQYKKLFFIP